MIETRDVPDETAPAPFQRRSPATSVAAALAAGIGCDHFRPMSVGFWLALCACALVGWGVCFWRSRLAPGALCLLTAVGAGGGAWHYLNWSIVADDHVAGFARETPQPVRIAGRIVDSPWLVPKREAPLPSSMPQSDRVLCTLECHALLENRNQIPVSGRVRLEISESAPTIDAGDLVVVVGRLSRPSIARNPGGFDFRRYLRASGLHAILRCDEADDVRVTGSTGGGWRRWQSHLRRRSEALVASHLSPETSPVGTALLLGTRSAVPEDVRLAFAESGTTHILAISGANVATLAILLWCLCHVAGISRRMGLRLVLTGVLIYAFVAEAQPPVVRAACMITLVLVGVANGRSGALLNAMSLAVVFVLVMNPLYLFDVGAQLSFLAVGALVWSPNLMRWRSRGKTDREPQDLATPDIVRRWGRFAWKWTVNNCCLMGAVWLFTLPMTLSRFHLLSTVGLGVNILLAPLVTIVLACGYALLLAAWVSPWLAFPFAWGFDVSLKCMLWIVAQSANVPFGHQYLAGPPEWWLAGFYVGLAAIVFGAAGGAVRRAGRRGLLVWTVIGLSAALWPAEPVGLRCTFLSVGHGAAVLLELPDGATLLYDAGQLTDANRAQQTVQNALWARGRSSIDAVVISHADVDHFNGIPGLAQTVSIGQALLHRTFFDFDQPSVRKLCESLERRHVPMKLVWQGDRVRLGENSSVDVEVLQPPANGKWASDNANSIVLRVTYAGRVILLTGDLEGDGLRQLLSAVQEPVDVLLAPHHGSANANTRGLARWARPRWVISSSGRPGVAARLQKVYGSQVRVLSTYDTGAVTMTITPAGEITETCHLAQPTTEE